MKSLYYLLALSVFGLFFACDDNSTESDDQDTHVHTHVVLNFSGAFGASALNLNTKYTTSASDTVQFTTLKFYVSEIALIDSFGVEHPIGSIHMVDFSAADYTADGKFSLELEADPGFYRGLKFNVGVPFSENHKNAATQTAPLGASSGMYWSWNPGYIFHMIEGKTDSAGKAINFGWHVGEDTRNLTVRLATLSGTTKTSFTVESGKDNAFNVSADYSKLFDTGLNPSGKLSPKNNVSERIHHVGPKNLADRIYANTSLIFSRQ